MEWRRWPVMLPSQAEGLLGDERFFF